MKRKETKRETLDWNLKKRMVKPNKKVLYKVEEEISYDQYKRQTKEVDWSCNERDSLLKTIIERRMEGKRKRERR